MTSLEQIDIFIKHYASIYSQNPNLAITNDTIYNELRHYGLNSNDIKDMDIRYTFDNLINKFKNSQNIIVYNDARQNRFLQFRNWHQKDSKCVKMYLSYPKEYIEQAATKIFSFIDKNNMETISKTADTLRSDSIVIRLRSQEDAKMVRDFINSDNELTSYAKNTNPFSIKDGVVGIGYDDGLSYNQQVSVIVAKYYESLRKGNNFEKASGKDFALFVSKYYQDTFVNCSKLEELVDSPVFQRMRSRFKTTGSEIYNHEQVTRLIVATVNGAMNIDMFNNYYDDCLDNKKSEDMINYYSSIHKTNVSNLLNKNKQSVNKTQLLNSYIAYAANKYGIENVNRYLFEYMNGNDKAITRDNNYRFYFNEYLSPNELSIIVGNNLDSYIHNAVSLKPIEDKMTENSKYIIFYEACKETFNKYGYKQLYAALKEASNGNYSGFTSGQKGYRKIMIDNFDKANIVNYCKIYLNEKGYNVNDEDIISTFANDISNDLVNNSEFSY